MEQEQTPQVEERSDSLHVEDTPAQPSPVHEALRGLSYEEGAALLQPPPLATPPPKTERQELQEKLATWSKTPPKKNYRRVRYRGVTVSVRTRQLLRRAEQIMRVQFRLPDFRFELSQGSYNKGVAASAGTHDGGGAVDIRTRGYSKREVNKMVRAMRMAGFAAWSRGRGHDSLSPHIHAIAIGDKELTPIARAQVGDFAHGRNGLKGHAKDPDGHLEAEVPRWAQRKLDKMK